MHLQRPFVQTEQGYIIDQSKYKYDKLMNHFEMIKCSLNLSASTNSSPTRIKYSGWKSFTSTPSTLSQSERSYEDDHDYVMVPIVNSQGVSAPSASQLSLKNPEQDWLLD